MSGNQFVAEKTTVNIRITETFLSDVDATWEDLGYNSRSEFVRDVLRDAVKHPSSTVQISRRLLRARSTFRKVEPPPAREIKAEYGRDDASEQ